MNKKIEIIWTLQEESAEADIIEVKFCALVCNFFGGHSLKNAWRLYRFGTADIGKLPSCNFNFGHKKTVHMWVVWNWYKSFTIDSRKVALFTHGKRCNQKYAKLKNWS